MAWLDRACRATRRLRQGPGEAYRYRRTAGVQPQSGRPPATAPRQFCSTCLLARGFPGAVMDLPGHPHRRRVAAGGCTTRARLRPSRRHPDRFHVVTTRQVGRAGSATPLDGPGWPLDIRCRQWVTQTTTIKRVDPHQATLTTTDLRCSRSYDQSLRVLVRRPCCGEGPAVAATRSAGSSAVPPVVEVGDGWGRTSWTAGCTRWASPRLRRRRRAVLGAGFRHPKW